MTCRIDEVTHDDVDNDDVVQMAWWSLVAWQVVDVAFGDVIDAVASLIVVASMWHYTIGQPSAS